MVVGVVLRVLRHGVLGERALSDVNPHAAQIQRGIRSARLNPRATAPAAAASHFAASAAVPDQFLIQLIVQGTPVLVAVQSIVQASRVQVVIRILEREQTVFCGQTFVSCENFPSIDPFLEKKKEKMSYVGRSKGMVRKFRRNS